jgi:hypothetical protein
MSRYTFRGEDPRHTIVVGWDNPLLTYFAQVWDERSSEDYEPELWVGCKIGEIETVDELAEVVAAYGELPAEIVASLEQDLRESMSKGLRRWLILR